MELSDLSAYQEVQMPIHASFPCSPISVGRLLALGPGSVVLTERAPGENVDITTGGVVIGKAELAWRGDATIARMIVIAEKTR
jgi:flagellar motor switch/type III secretory pathway protein FliN